MEQEQVDLKTAAEHLGTSVDALRKRIKRGSLKGEVIRGRQYVWLDKVDGGPADTDTGQPPGGHEASQRPDDVITALVDQLRVKDEQIAAKDRQISELIGQAENYQVLLKQANEEKMRLLPAPKADERTTVHSEAQSPMGDSGQLENSNSVSEPPAQEPERRRRWWQFWK